MTMVRWRYADILLQAKHTVLVCVVPQYADDEALPHPDCVSVHSSLQTLAEYFKLLKPHARRPHKHL